MHQPFFFRSTPAAEKNILQQIVFCPETIPDVGPLYMRTQILSGGGQRTDTDSFVNIFHKQRWEKIAALRRPALEVTCRGEGRLLLLVAQEISSPDVKENPFQEAARLDVNEANAPATFRAELPDGQAFCSFSWEEDSPGLLQIERACFVEEAEEGELTVSSLEKAVNQVRLALVIATWHRPMEASRLAEKYRVACSHRKDFAEHSHLFIVNNDPAAKDSFPLRSDTDMTVLHSHANIGGAGAFALGARAALERSGFSHVVFMDDDILVPEESWFRTISLLRRLQSAYRDQIVSGAMLKLEKPCYCHVMQEALDSKGNAVTLSGDQDIQNAEGVFRLLDGVRTEKSDNMEGRAAKCFSDGIRPYAAWWYCVLPTDLFAERGFPLPLFFRGDDQEFGLRVGRMTLPLNGIFVWHPAFEHKKSLLRLYLGFRNGAVTALLHLPCWRRIVFRRFFLNAWRELLSGRHSACALRVLALQDFMHFWKLPIDGDRLTERLGKWLAFFQEGRRPLPHLEPEQCPYAPAQIARLAALLILTAWRLWRFDAPKARAEFEKLMQPKEMLTPALLSAMGGP